MSIVSDDFTGGAVDQVWTVAGPAGTSAGLGTYGSDGFLELVTPDGDHDVWGANNGARAMQAAADGDFQLAARFLTAPGQKYQMQGFLIEQDASNWIRLDIYHDGSKLRAFGAVTLNGVSSAKFNVAIPGDAPPFLRATRAGDVWTLEYSLDGTVWSAAGSFSQALTVTEAGVFAGNTGQAQGYTARVDWFENTASPILDEDGTIDPVNDAPVAVDDPVTEVPGTSLFIDVLGNDEDRDGDALTIVGVTDGIYGDVIIQGSEVGYLRDTDGPAVFPGDSFTYTVEDPSGARSTATVTIASETPPPSEVTVTRQVTFDGEQGGTKGFDTLQGGKDNDLESGNGDRTGLVFEDVAIAAGATIESAFLTLTSQRGQGGTANIEIRLFDDADAIASSGNGVLTDPGFDTFDFVPFQVTDSWAKGERIDTPDLSSLIQNLIDTDTQADGTYDLSFALASFDGIRRIEAEEFGDDVAAELSITYGVSDTPNTAPMAAVAGNAAGGLEDAPSFAGALPQGTDAEDDDATLSYAVSGAAIAGLTLQPDGAFSYAPPADFAGDVSFDYVVIDGRGAQSVPQGFTITVEAVNDAPDLTLGADLALGEDPGAQSVAGFALSGPGGGADEAGQIVTLDVQNDNAGLFSVAPSIDAAGTLGFTPAPGALGQATVTVTATDDGGTANGGVDATQRTFVITISETDAPPVAVNDAETTSEDVAVAIDVLFNDTDADGGPKAVVGFSQGANGAVTATGDGTLTYTPDADFNGTDSFTYSLTPGGSGATVTVTIDPVNDAPVAVDDPVTEVPGTSLFIDVLGNDEDRDGDALTIVGVTDGIYGDVIIQGSEVGYLRDTDGPAVFPGDSFTYTVEDPSGARSTATVTIASETPPPSEVTVTRQVTFDGEQGGTKGFDTLQGGKDNDLESGNGDRTGLVFEDVAIAAGATIESAFLTLTSQRGQGGTANIEIRLFDDADAIASSGNGVLTDPGFDTFDFVPFQVTDSWAKGERIDTPDLSSLIQNLIDTDTQADGTYDLSFALASFDGIRRIEAEEFGDDVAAELSITYGVSDTPNTAPMAAVAGNAAGGLEDAPSFAGALPQGTDAEDDDATLSYAVSGAAIAGLTLQPDGAFSYAPPADFAGDVSFDYVVIDGRGAQSVPQGFTITVEAVNDAPDLTLGADLALGEDPGAQSVAGFALSGPGGGADEAGQIVTLDVQNDNAGLFSVAPSIDAAGTLGFTPAPGALGQATVTVTATDDGGTANGGVDATQRTFVITISETDAPPVAVNDAETTSEDVAVAIDVLFNDTDADGGPKAVVGFSQGANGAVTATGDGTLTYTPDADFNGTDSFTYSLTPGGSGATVTVTIDPVNDAPVAVDDPVTEVPGTSLFIDVLGNDEDRDGDALTIVGVTDGIYGDVIIQGSEVGYLRDTDGPAVFPGDSFTYTVEDPSGARSTATVTIASETPPPSASSIVSDDFTGGAVDQVWTVAGPAGTSAGLGTYGSDGFLELVTPDGDHDVWGANNGARAMQAAADGDFQLAARFLTAPGQKYQMQGFLIEQDASNWIRLDIYHDGSKLRAFGAVTLNGVSSAKFNVAIPGDAPPFLRATRAGDVWTLEYSLDGTVWSAAGSFSQALTVTGAGVFAGNTGQAQGYTARVDWFENTASPILDEDGTIDPVNDAPVAVDDAFLSEQDAELTIPVADLLANDGDANGDTLSLAGFTQPSQGVLADNGDGTLRYTPAAGYSGPDNFTYTVSDGTLADTATVSLTVGSPINVWYGPEQTFGSIGEAQEWVNILGNITGDVTSLKYSLNGGPSRTLSIGADTRRLQNEGDFNIDLAYSELDGSDGDDIITITATMASGAVHAQDVKVDYDAGNVWDANYAIEWDLVTDIQDVAQIVDGIWTIEAGGVRPVDLGYDRVIAIGDRSWDNYELSMSISTHDLLNIDPRGRDGGGFAIGMLWNGHTDTPVKNFQPKSGWEPGAAFFYSDSDANGVGRLALHPSTDFFSTLARKTFTLQENRTYESIIRVEQSGLYDRTFSLKLWEQGTPEPDAWTMQGTQLFDIAKAPATGSIYLNAHYFDVTFNDLSVTEIPGRDIVQGTEDGDTLSGVEPGTPNRGVGEIDVLAGYGGADLFIVGDMSGSYYDDGASSTDGDEDFAFIWDFESGVDKIMLSGSSNDYRIDTYSEGPAYNLAIWRYDYTEELVAVLNDPGTLNLASTDFVFTDDLMG